MGIFRKVEILSNTALQNSTISSIKLFRNFQKYKIKGVKGKYFEDFCNVAKLMKENKHFTPPRPSYENATLLIKNFHWREEGQEGLNKIKKKNKSRNESRKRIIKINSPKP